MPHNKNNELSGGGLKKNNELKKESDALNEFLSGEWDPGKSLQAVKSVFFSPLEFPEEESVSYYLPKLAASSEPPLQGKSNSYFYISNDDKYALKIDEVRSGEESSLVATVIMEESESAADCLLYCHQTKKYFIISSSNEITLSGYTGFDYKKFTFELLFPLNIFTVIREQPQENFVVISEEPEFSSTEYKLVNEYFEVINSKFRGIRAAIVKSDKYRDFVPLKGEIISVPAVFIYLKFEILVY